jgi:hypothetical protein
MLVAALKNLELRLANCRRQKFHHSAQLCAETLAFRARNRAFDKACLERVNSNVEKHTGCPPNGGSVRGGPSAPG